MQAGVSYVKPLANEQGSHNNIWPRSSSPFLGLREGGPQLDRHRSQQAGAWTKRLRPLAFKSQDTWSQMAGKASGTGAINTSCHVQVGQA